MKIFNIETQEGIKLTKVISIFNRLFEDSENTILISGAKEPFYRASVKNTNAQIHSREDFLSSTLHEIAHWTIAGEKRRQLDDFGYWYEAEGRSEEQQNAFEQVEVKPQAIEWILSLACKQSFNFSADNLEQEALASLHFKEAVYNKAVFYLKDNLPESASELLKEFTNTFRHGDCVLASELEIDNA